MANPVFGWPIFSDPSALYSPSLSGGSYASSLPITNLQDRRLGAARVARTTDATTGSTKFIFSLGRTCAIGCLAVLVRNITRSSTPTVRWKLGTTSGASDVYDSGLIQAFPSGVTLDDIIGPDGTPMKVWTPHIPSAIKNAAFAECDVTDTANVDGRLDFARAIVAGAYQPTEPMSVGARTGTESDSERSPNDGGGFLYRAKPNRRVDTLTIPKSTQAEGLDTIRKMIRNLGTVGQFYWVPDPSDTTRLWDRSYLATMKETPPLEHSTAARMDAQFSIVEDI